MRRKADASESHHKRKKKKRPTSIVSSSQKGGGSTGGDAPKKRLLPSDDMREQPKAPPPSLMLKEVSACVIQQWYQRIKQKYACPLALAPAIYSLCMVYLKQIAKLPVVAPKVPWWCFSSHNTLLFTYYALLLTRCARPLFPLGFSSMESPTPGGRPRRGRTLVPAAAGASTSSSGHAPAPPLHKSRSARQGNSNVTNVSGNDMKGLVLLKVGGAAGVLWGGCTVALARILSFLACPLPTARCLLAA